jgi:PKD repeat protein
MFSIITGRSALKNHLVLAALWAGVIVAAGCNKVPLLAPGLSTITLSTSSTIVQSNGTAQVSATIMEQGGSAVQNGTTVTFTTTLGAVSPTTATTVNGVATTQFRANGQSGIAEVRATSGGAKLIDATTTSPGTGLKLTVGGAAASRVAVTANPATLPAIGGSSTIVANVVDASGNALSGVAVTFSTTLGGLSSGVATTDSSGNAQTTLTTTKQAVVTATAGGAAATGAAGSSTSAPSTGTVTVAVNTAPGAVTIAASPTAPTTGQPVAISVTAASGASPVQRIQIDFGDGASTTVTGSSGGASHVYAQAGTYVVRATAFDLFGDSGSSTTAVTVVARLLAVTISSGTANPAPGSAIAFTIAATPTTGNQITSISIDFGDNSSRTLPGNASSVQHVFAAADTYTVTAMATDSAGATGSGSTVIVVGNATAANFTFQPSTGVVGQPITFDGSSSPSSSGIASYSWTFGDSSTSGSGVTITHTYAAAGSFTVTLTVVDNAGRSASTSKVVIVR